MIQSVMDNKSHSARFLKGGGKNKKKAAKEESSGTPFIEPDPHIVMQEDAQRGALPRVQWIHDRDLKTSKQLTVPLARPSKEEKGGSSSGAKNYLRNRFINFHDRDIFAEAGISPGTETELHGPLHAALLLGPAF